MAMLLSVQLGTEFDLASTKPILTTAMNDAGIAVMERAMVHYPLTILVHFTYHLCLYLVSKCSRILRIYVFRGQFSELMMVNNFLKSWMLF